VHEPKGGEGQTNCASEPINNDVCFTLFNAHLGLTQSKMFGQYCIQKTEHGYIDSQLASSAHAFPL